MGRTLDNWSQILISNAYFSLKDHFVGVQQDKCPNKWVWYGSLGPLHKYHINSLLPMIFHVSFVLPQSVFMFIWVFLDVVLPPRSLITNVNNNFVLYFRKPYIWHPFDIITLHVNLGLVSLSEILTLISEWCQSTTTEEGKMPRANSRYMLVLTYETGTRWVQ